MSEKKENRFVRMIVIAAVASFAILPLTFHGCGPEWARWDATQANMYFRRGQTEDALYQLRDAISKSPRDPVLKLTLAQRLIEIDKHDEALELANKVLEVFPDNAKASEVISNAYQEKGDFESALAANVDFHERSGIRRDINGLNELAYFRALAKTDLNLAKADIETVVRALNNSLNWPGDEELDTCVKSTALAAMVSRCCGAEQAAIDVLSPQIDQLRLQIRVANGLLTREVYKLSQDSFPVRQDEAVLKRQQLLDKFDRRAATLLSCRALLYQDSGDIVGCEADRREVLRLGFDSTEIVNQLPDERMALAMLSGPSAFLDTRGLIYSLLPWDDNLEPDNSRDKNSYSNSADAARDLNVAILCSEIGYKALDHPLGNAIELNEDDKRAAEKTRKHQLAVLLYHRMTLHERIGNDELKNLDAERIRKLGHEPGAGLF